MNIKLISSSVCEKLLKIISEELIGEGRIDNIRFSCEK